MIFCQSYVNVRFMLILPKMKQYFGNPWTDVATFSKITYIKCAEDHIIAAF